MEKIKIIQIGMCHEHANGKIEFLKRNSELFDLIGYVDERSFSTTPRMPNPYQPELYTDLKQLTLDEALNYPGLEAVMVEVPNNELVPISIKCMERGLAMHMDKPAGEDLSLYKKLLDGCKAKNIPFQMGFMFRGNPAFQFAIKAIREKVIGDVVEMDLDMNHCYGGEEYQEYLSKFPGGIMYNLGCHLIDFIVAAMGRPEKITPFLRSAPGYADRYKTNCLSVLEYPHAIATVRACCKAPCGSRRMRIVGTKGAIYLVPLERFDGKNLKLELELCEDTQTFPKGWHTLEFPPQKYRYDVQLQEFAGMIRGKCKPSYSYEHDYLVHEVTLAAAGYTKWS